MNFRLWKLYWRILSIFILLILLISAVCSLRLSGLYRKAAKQEQKGNYEEALQIYDSISFYKDSKEKIRGLNLYEEKQNALREKYEEGVRDFELGAYSVALSIFDELQSDDFEESKYYYDLCKEKIAESKDAAYKNAILKYDLGEYKDALVAFNLLENYLDSVEYAKKCRHLIEIETNRDSVIAAGVRYSLGIDENGKLLTAGSGDQGQCDTYEINKDGDLISVDGYGTLTIGLKNNGEATILGTYNDGKSVDLSKWKDLVDVAAGQQFVIGLKKDGTVIGDGHRDDGQIDVGDWKDVVMIDAGWRFSVGLTKENELLFSGKYGKQNEEFLKEKDKWKDVVFISASGGEKNENGGIERGGGHTVGLKSDGTVVAVGDNSWGQCDVDEWSDITKVAAGDWYTVGLKSDGTVLITGENKPRTEYIDIDIISGLDNVVDIAAGYGQTLCLKSDGTVVPFGFNDDGKRDEVRKWKNVAVPNR